MYDAHSPRILVVHEQTERAVSIAASLRRRGLPAQAAADFDGRQHGAVIVVVAAEHGVDALADQIERTVGPVSGRADLLRFEDLELDPASRRARRGESDITLSQTESRLLEFLMRHPRVALSRAQLHAAVWNGAPRRSRVLDRCVSDLRHKLDEAGPPLIHTIRGVGYMLRPRG